MSETLTDEETIRPKLKLRHKVAFSIGLLSPAVAGIGAGVAVAHSREATHNAHAVRRVSEEERCLKVVRLGAADKVIQITKTVSNEIDACDDAYPVTDYEPDYKFTGSYIFRGTEITKYTTEDSFPSAAQLEHDIARGTSDANHFDDDNRYWALPVGAIVGEVACWMALAVGITAEEKLKEWME